MTAAPRFGVAGVVFAATAAELAVVVMMALASRDPLAAASDSLSGDMEKAEASRV
jgi:hypothetical protein